MKFYKNISDYPKNRQVVLSIGKFSSVHLGHQRIIRKVVSLAREKTTKTKKVYSLLILILPETESRFFSLEFSCKIFQGLGIDDVIVFALKDIRLVTYDVFLKDLLQKFHVKNFVASRKLRIGHEKEGTPEKIEAFFEKNKFYGGEKIEIVWLSSIFFDDVVGDEKKYEEISKSADLAKKERFFEKKQLISSSSLESFMEKGLAQKARMFAFLPFTLEGVVIHGKGKGKDYGFPTANFHYPPDLVVCKKGSYASFALIGEKLYKSMTYVGFFQENTIVETYLFNFTGSLYNKHLRIFLFSHIRDDEKPRDSEHLKKLLRADSIKCRSFLDGIVQTGSFSFLRFCRRLVSLKLVEKVALQE